MQDYEKLGSFYLGKRITEESGDLTDELILYDAKDLTTHAVIIGMTGSGKTGLGVGLIEEAALDHVPVIAIDPKGDLGNLLLSFPKLTAKEFEPWVDPRAAAEKGLTTAEFAKSTAAMWRKGLADWGQSSERIAALHAAVDMAIFTPGSTAGTPLSVLGEFSAPTAELLADRDLYRERLQGTATGLLTLLEMDADPVSSREHILLSNVLDHAWQQQQSLSLSDLIQQIQSPELKRIGVMDLDTFYPAKERFALAMRVNNLLAAPGFEAWMSGQPLDIDRLFYGATGKPQISVLSIAHLGDAERMFFVTMLLTEVIAWMRRQTGSGSLRAILYMDEIFGYLPPVANPASKRLFLTLLKQARAFGLGLVLSTQNPVDLDYKALSNAGTWFIGRLQTKRDRDRVRDGLQSAAGSINLDGADLDSTISGLGKRRFLLHNVHEQHPVLMETRWVLSYLAGPLTRDQIKILCPESSTPVSESTASAVEPAQRSFHSSRPVMASDIRQFFIPVCKAEQNAFKHLIYYPRLIAYGQIDFHNARLQINERQNFFLTVDIDEATSGSSIWDNATETDIDPADLDIHNEQDAHFADCPAKLTSTKNIVGWEKSLRRWLRAEQPLTLYKSKTLKEVSRPGEPEREFRIRLQQIGHEQRDLKVAKLRERFEKQVATQEGRLLRARQTLERQSEQASAQKLDTALSFGTAILGALLGRKRVSVTSASRAGSAMRKASKIGKESADVRRAEQTVAAVQTRIVEIQHEFDDQIEALDAAYDAQEEELIESQIRPRMTDIHIEALGIGWFPYREDENGRLRAA